jgi:hypothetical protein
MNHSITQIAFIRMTTRDNVFLWLGVAGLLIIAAAVWFTRDTSSIGYHLRQLQATRTLLRYANCPMRGITRESLNWNTHGRPSIRALEAVEERHEAALVRLGYYERREFLFQRHALTPQTHWHFSLFLSTNGFPAHSSFRWSTTSPALVVTASARDMSQWQSKVVQDDAT